MNFFLLFIFCLNIQAQENFLQKYVHSDLHNAKIGAVKLSPDGTKVVTGMANSFSVKLWNTNTGEVLSELSSFDPSVNVVDFSPDGKYVAIGTWGYNPVVVIWDIESDIIKHKITVHTAEQSFNAYADVEAVAFSRDGKILLTGTDQGTPPLKAWDVETGENLHLFDDYGVPTYSLDFSSNGQYILTSSHLLDLMSGEIIHRFYPFPHFIKEDKVISFEAGNIWNTVNEELIQKFPPIEGKVLSLSKSRSLFLLSENAEGVNIGKIPESKIPFISTKINSAFSTGDISSDDQKIVLVRENVAFLYNLSDFVSHIPSAIQYDNER